AIRGSFRSDEAHRFVRIRQDGSTYPTWVSSDGRPLRSAAPCRNPERRAGAFEQGAAGTPNDGNLIPYGTGRVVSCARAAPRFPTARRLRLRGGRVDRASGASAPAAGRAAPVPGPRRARSVRAGADRHGTRPRPP